MANAPAAPATEEPVPGPAAVPTGKRRQFREDDKRRIVEEACQPGASLSGVARRYGIGVRLLFRWKQALGLGGC